MIELWKTPKTAVPNDTGFVRKYVISTNIVNRQSIGKADLADSCGLKSFPGLERHLGARGGSAAAEAGPPWNLRQLGDIHDAKPTKTPRSDSIAAFGLF